MNGEIFTLDMAIDVGRVALEMVFVLSLPLLLVGLVVGMVISVLQAATQVQEQTLSFIPKIFAVAGALFILLPWLIVKLVEYTEDLFQKMILWI